MRAPVDLRPAKVALTPYYQQVLEQWPETQRAASPGFLALKRIVEGPDFRPADAVDQDLSLIKAIVREAPAMLRNRSQGLAAVAAASIDPAVRRAVYQHGGAEAAYALQRGREAVATKHRTAEVLRNLPKEPVGLIAKLLRPRDSNITLLRTLAEHAPEQLPDIGRAWIQRELDLARSEGDFTHTDRLWADWNTLGPLTKDLVFGDHLHDIHNFFLLAKKLGLNPNPSGSGGTVIASGLRSTGVAEALGAAMGYAHSGVEGGAAAAMVVGALKRIDSNLFARVLYNHSTAPALLTVMRMANGMRIQPGVAVAAATVLSADLTRIAHESSQTKQGAAR